MMIDYITSCFQVGAIIFLCISIRKLYIDQELKGVSVWMMTYFTVWGYWGTYMFWKLGQFWSMSASIGLSVAYTIWLGLAFLGKMGDKN